MIRIKIKPISTNDLYVTQKKVRRYKSKKYKKFIHDLIMQLPEIDIHPSRLEIWINIGVSNSGFDMFNAEKGFVDTLQKKYGFNDNKIFKAHMEKQIVAKGSEYIEFTIEALK